jgi:hypothetical protein
MKVKILVDTVANKKIVKAGDVVEVKDADGRLLIGIKKAVLYKEEPQQQQSAEPEAPVAQQESGEEPAPKKKGKK